MPTCPFCKLRTITGKELQDHLTQKHPEEMVVSGGNRNNQRPKSLMKSGEPIIVDGNNIAYSRGEPAKIRYIKSARTILKKRGYQPIIYVSAALRHNIDQPHELNRLINLGWVREVEGGQDDDVAILEAAQRKKCKIVTNDRYTDYHKDYATKDWQITSNLQNFSIVDEKFQLY